MIEKIVNDKKSLELMMKYAAAQSKSKKPSEIFENFYKLSQTDYKKQLDSLDAFLADEITSFPLTKEINETNLKNLINTVKKEIDDRYKVIYGPIFYNIYGDKADENKIDAIKDSIFKDDDSKRKWISGLITNFRINQKKAKDKDEEFVFSVEVYLKGLYNNFRVSKDKTVDIETPGLIFSDESALEAFEEIDERVDSEPENMETQENFNLIEELLNQKIKVAELNNEFYALFVFESVLLDTFKKIQNEEK